MNPLIRFKRINLRLLIATALMCLFASLTLWAQQHQSVDNNGGDRQKEFSVSSSTFTDGGTLPLITVWNQCSNYPGGSDESPELSWTTAPQRTESFVVVAYDVTWIRSCRAAAQHSSQNHSIVSTVRTDPLVLSK